MIFLIFAAFITNLKIPHSLTNRSIHPHLIYASWSLYPGEDSAIAMQGMRELKERHNWHLEILHNYISWDDAELVGDVNHPESLQAWKTISRLYNRPWFSHAWVVQEVSGQKNLSVICEREAIDFIALTVTFMIVQELMLLPHSKDQVVYRVIEEERSAIDNWSRIATFEGARLQKKPCVTEILSLLEIF